MSMGINKCDIWLSADETSFLLGISKETLRRNCKAEKFVSISKKSGKYKEYNVLLSSLPEKAQDKYYSQQQSKEISLELNLEIYSNAPNWAKKQADKYVKIINESKGLKGKDLSAFVDEWNAKYPKDKTSYASVMLARKKFEEKGLSGLLANYGNNKGKTKIQNEHYEYFKSLYLKEGAPSAFTCWLMTLGYARKFEHIPTQEFPKALTFKRKIENEIPAQSIYLARYGQAAWNKKFARYIARDYSTILAGSCWVSDHAQIDVAVKLGDKTIFPWVTVFRDFKSAKWVGWLLHAEFPNSDHIFQSFYYGASDYGLPRKITCFSS